MEEGIQLNLELPDGGMAESETRVATRSRSSMVSVTSGTDGPRNATVDAHADPAHHPAASRRFHVPRWLLSMSAVAAVAAIVFLLVPDGGSTALLVLFLGLMMVHHLPGLGHHGGHTASRAAPGEQSVATGTGDSARDSVQGPPHH